jgi:hypothetical protein
VLLVVTGTAIGHLLAYEPKDHTLRWAAIGPALVLVIALFPAARNREQATKGLIVNAHHASKALTRLEDVIAMDGGAARIKACGQPVSNVRYQSELAWALGLNVGNVGYNPSKVIAKGVPMVLFKPIDDGWKVIPIHSLAADAASCAGLRAESALG